MTRIVKLLLSICIALLSLAISTMVPASSAAEGGSKESADSSQASEIPLRQDPQGRWVAATTTSGGVNIVGLTWQAAGAAGDDVGHARLRTGTNGVWQPWQEMVISETEISTGTDGDLIMGALDLEVELEAGAEADSVLLTVWNVPSKPADASAETNLRVDGSTVKPSSDARTERQQTEQTMAVASATGPNIATRAQWGADESVRKWSPNYIEGTKGITIHHTAGSNNYSAVQVPSILRGIYQYHAVTRGWGDVGYNLFVDKYGRAWEGRRGGPESSLRTAHALGMNYDTAGIALVGDYSNTEVPRAAFDGMAQLTAWKLQNHGISPSSTFIHENDYLDWTRTLNSVHGHRDVNSTSCPGERFYRRMSEFRSRVAQYGQNLTGIQRVAGPDRYATAAQLATDSHPFGADIVYITRGDALIAALAAGSVAAHEDGALVLTRDTSLPAATASALGELDPARVVVIGGPEEISDSVVRQIRTASGASVSRLQHPDQYSLAADLSKAWQSPDVVYMASGQEPADSLSGGAAAAHDDAPLLLASDGDLPDATAAALTRLEPQRVILLGGTVRITASTANAIRALLPGSQVARIAGVNRYETSERIARQSFEGSRRAFLANGYASIDAIAGTQYAAASDSPVLLTSRTCRSAGVDDAIDQLGVELNVLMGGTTRLSNSSATAVCR